MTDEPSRPPEADPVTPATGMPSGTPAPAAGPGSWRAGGQPPPVAPPPWGGGPPYGAPGHAPPAGRVPGWLWPVVAALALVLGVVGGATGSVLLRIAEQNGGGLVSGGLAGVDTVTEPPLEAENGSVAAVAGQLLPSTVQVLAEVGGQPAGATGSGFVLDRQGHVVTNNHVVQEAAEDDGEIEVVRQDGRRFAATVVGRSPVYDLAVLAVEDARALQPAALGASDRLRVGETVVAFGSPLGLSSTVTAGIVSAKDRPVTTGQADDDTSYINAVQTDAAINPGNSGGPLVDMQGRVVGVNSAIATTGSIGTEGGNIGVGFAIPVEQVRVTADQILRTGEARYPVIGAQVMTGGRGSGTGALVDEVVGGSPADDGGLRAEDRVVRVDGQPVTDGIGLIVAIRTHQPGERVEFQVVRDGERRTVEIRLGGEVG